MNNNFTITIDGKQIVTEGVEKLSLTTRGDFSHEDNRYSISYQESETTGFDGDITTLVIESNSRATLTRNGKTHSNLVIEKGKKHLCHYDTGEGTFVIGVLADKIDNKLHEHGGVLKLRYKLDVNSNALSTNELNITVRENTANA
ncbi:MAG: DUF1934 domain-containing protein [Oscillospiraceae bacterium]